MNKYFSTLHELIGLLESAFKSLDCDVSSEEVENLASVIHQVMSARYRTYHTVHHALDLCRESRPIEVLAGAFHDTIYVQVDKRIHPLLKSYTSNFQLADNYTLILPSLNDFDSMDPAREVYEIFGYEPGKELGPYSGINEFLSAVVASRMLQKHLSVWQRLQMVSVIEATIPFRPINSEGLTATDLLKNRLKKASQQRSLNLKESDLDMCIKGTVRLANLDVANFASKNVGEYLNGTWDLCLEGNPVFRNPLYSTSQYRNAIQRVEGFIAKMTPHIIFRQYQGVPSDSKYKDLLNQCAENLSILLEYLHAKLIEVAVLESIATLSGGDCPIALFFGELPTGGQHHISALDEYLNPKIPKKHEGTRLPKVLNLLSGGRSKASYFDFNHSPIGAYLYERLSRDEFTSLVNNSKKFFSGETTPVIFLQAVPNPLLLAIIDALSEVNWVRRSKIQSLRRHF